MDREEERSAVESGLMKKKVAMEARWDIQRCCRERVCKKTGEMRKMALEMKRVKVKLKHE